MHLRAARVDSWQLCVCLLAVALLPAARAARVPGQWHLDTDRSASRGAYPFLRWLRDSTVELVFGRPATKSYPDIPSASSVASRYRNEIVVRFNVTSPEEEEALSVAARTLFLDVWDFTPEYVDIRLPRKRIEPLLSLLPDTLLPTVFLHDVAGAAWNTYPSKQPLAACDFEDYSHGKDIMTRLYSDGLDNLFFRDYQPLSVITSWLRLLEDMFPHLIKLSSVGKSYEGRDIPSLRVGDRRQHKPEEGPRKTIVVTGGIHAREWISVSTVTFLLWSYITAYEKDSMVTKFLQHFDIVFIPVLNPDGYQYTWEVDRLWRKSRQPTELRSCTGLDLDHAFGYEWQAEMHHAHSPCSGSYGGNVPFEAVEASTFANWAKNLTEKDNAHVIGFLDLHSYSQQVLYPYSHTCGVDPPNLEDLEELAAGIAKAIRLSSGEYYAVASACEGAFASAKNASGALPRMESGAGSAIDWFYHEMKARFSYQIKLRDTGAYGFLLPPENIVPTGQEMFHAMKYFGDFLLGNNGIEKLFPDAAQPQVDERMELRRRSGSRR